MKNEEFVRLAVLCGYANRRTAEAYVRGRQDDLTDDDFITVSRMGFRALLDEKTATGKWRRQTDGTVTTKRYLQDGADNR